MDRARARLALLKISLVTLLLSSWVFVSFIFSTRPEQPEANALTALVRLPASIPSQLPQQLPDVFASPSKPVEPVDMNTVDIPCWDKAASEENSTTADWVRLTGRTCLVKISNELITVRNTTTGYVATVFPTQGDTLTTDFIPLQPGKNEIRIRFEQGPGAATESQVSFFRE